MTLESLGKEKGNLEGRVGNSGKVKESVNIRRRDFLRQATRVLVYGGALSLATGTIAVAVYKSEFTSPSKINEVNYESVESILQITSNPLAYDNKSVQLSDKNLWFANYSTNDVSLKSRIIQGFFQDTEVPFINNLQLIIKEDDSEITLENSLHCDFRSNNQKIEYEKADKILNNGRYKGSFVLRGIIKKSIGRNIPYFIGHSIDLEDPETGEMKTYHLSDLYLK